MHLSFLPLVVLSLLHFKVILGKSTDLPGFECDDKKGNAFVIYDKDVTCKWLARRPYNKMKKICEAIPEAKKNCRKTCGCWELNFVFDRDEDLKKEILEKLVDKLVVPLEDEGEEEEPVDCRMHCHHLCMACQTLCIVDPLPDPNCLPECFTELTKCLSEECGL